MLRAHLSLIHPSLFAGLVLIDPVIQRGNPSRKYALPSTYRRDTWPSRREAMKKFQSSAFYRAWDPRVLEKWVEFGLRDPPTNQYPSSQDPNQPAVMLTTPKSQELFTFLRPSYIDKRSGLQIGNPSDEMHPDDIDDFPFYHPEPSHIFRRLPEVKPSVLYLFGESSDLSSPYARREKMETTGTGIGGSGGAARGRVHETVLPCGHLGPMELPQESAKSCASFIDAAVSFWNAEVSQYQDAWGKVPRDERNKIDEQWETHIRPLSKGTKL